MLIGFDSEEDWFDYRLENDPAFLDRVAQARASLRQGSGIPWDDVKAERAEFVTSDKPRRKRR